jgi:hypothetical protein
MKLSDVKTFFESKAFKGWKKSKEQEVKLQVAIIDRLDAVIKSIHNLGKHR